MLKGEKALIKYIYKLTMTITHARMADRSHE